RLSASRCPCFSSGQAIFVQVGISRGIRAPTRMGNGHSVLTAVQRFYECSSHRRATGWTWRGLSHQGGRRAVATAAIVFYSPYFFGDGGAAGVGAFAAPAGAGEGAGLAS